MLCGATLLAAPVPLLSAVLRVGGDDDEGEDDHFHDYDDDDDDDDHNVL